MIQFWSSTVKSSRLIQRTVSLRQGIRYNQIPGCGCPGRTGLLQDRSLNNSSRLQDSGRKHTPVKTLPVTLLEKKTKNCTPTVYFLNAGKKRLQSASWKSCSPAGLKSLLVCPYLCLWASTGLACPYSGYSFHSDIPARNDSH